MDKLRFNSFGIGSKLIDRNFYWKCVSITADYIKLNCRVESFDIFEFYYDTGLHGVAINSFDMDSFKDAQIPGYMPQYLLDHKDCFEIWHDSSLKGWLNCMTNGK